ncbi:MAG TPA: hypothetical protein EYQ50_02155 [Verrucomicrobiales bacterium]|jgi:TPR repeat protein|nr:hypothetical protein [Verrucomicrobiales bacterium]
MRLTTAKSLLRVTKVCGLGCFIVLLVGNLWFISPLEDPGRFFGDKKYYWMIYVAAVRGDANAQYNLGNAYRVGKGTVKDHAKKVRWYRKAAEQGLV